MTKPDLLSRLDTAIRNRLYSSSLLREARDEIKRLRSCDPIPVNIGSITATFTGPEASAMYTCADIYGIADWAKVAKEQVVYGSGMIGGDSSVAGGDLTHWGMGGGGITGAGGGG